MAAVLTSRPVICVASSTKNLVGTLKKKLPELVTKEVAVPLDEHNLEEIRQCDILLAGNDIIGQVLETPGNLKWAQSTWAGAETLVSKYRESTGLILTRNGHGFGQLMGEFVLGQVISWERDVHSLIAAQKQKLWKRDAVARLRPLTALSIGILGVGEIGRKVSQLCHSLGMQVYGMTRTPVPNNKRMEYIHEYRLFSEIQDFLPKCDYVCNILPSTPETKGLLNGEILKYCEPKKSIFINIGRGDVISEKDLLKALRSGWIGGAVLDVFEKEPLPPESPLWTEPGVIISPHCAGPCLESSDAECFLINYKRYVGGQDLLWRVDPTKGY